MYIKTLLNEIKDKIGGVLLASLISLILSVGVKWTLTFLLVPIMLLLVLLGVKIEIEPDTISLRLSVMSFVLAFVYIVYGDKLIRKTNKK